MREDATPDRLVERPRLSRLLDVDTGHPVTDRELTVLRNLQSILSNVEIATELRLSVNT